jgi:hypothetical protein
MDIQLFTSTNRRFFALTSFIILNLFHLTLQTGCPLFKCSPDSITLDYDRLNTTLDIKCQFLNRIDDPSDIMWKFNFNRMERIINDLDGGVLAPFKHAIRHSSNVAHMKRYGLSERKRQLSISSSHGSLSVLRIHLLNSSYFTNYTIMHTRDSCQQTMRVRLAEQALGYSSGSRNLVFFMFKDFYVFLHVILFTSWFSMFR